MNKPRLRDLGVSIGSYATGAHNAITDVPGVLVGHATLVYDQPRIARTGVTVILPREGNIWKNPAFAAWHTFNGCGEMTGTTWIEESGQLSTPIALTNTHQVGTVHEAVLAYGQMNGHTSDSSLPVVGETWDGWLNDMDGFHVTAAHVEQALRDAKNGPVAEGNVGGGTGMICHEFKGGIGTSSRVVRTSSGDFTLGALVQANHGSREDFRVDGVPVGRLLDESAIPRAWDEPEGSSSILVILATDAPLLSFQCRRLAKRATVGLSRAGGIGHNGSGDIFLAFATGNDLTAVEKTRTLTMLPNSQLDALFGATADAVEEAILNAIVAAETMTGYKGHVAFGLPAGDLRQVMTEYRPG